MALADHARSCGYCTVADGFLARAEEGGIATALGYARLLADVLGWDDDTIDRRLANVVEPGPRHESTCMVVQWRSPPLTVEEARANFVEALEADAAPRAPKPSPEEVRAFGLSSERATARAAIAAQLLRAAAKTREAHTGTAAEACALEYERAARVVALPDAEAAGEHPLTCGYYKAFAEDADAMCDCGLRQRQSLDLAAIEAAAREDLAVAGATSLGPWYGYQSAGGFTFGGPASQRMRALDIFEEGAGLGFCEVETDVLFLSRARTSIPERAGQGRQTAAAAGGNRLPARCSFVQRAPWCARSPKSSPPSARSRPAPRPTSAPNSTPWPRRTARAARCWSCSTRAWCSAAPPRGAHREAPPLSPSRSPPRLGARRPPRLSPFPRGRCGRRSRRLGVRGRGAMGDAQARADGSIDDGERRALAMNDTYLARLISTALLAAPSPLTADSIERVVLDAIEDRDRDRYVLAVLRERTGHLGAKKRQTAESLAAGVGRSTEAASVSLARLRAAGIVEEDADGVVRLATTKEPR